MENEKYKKTQNEINKCFWESINKKWEIDCRVGDIREMFRFRKSNDDQECSLLVEFVYYKFKLGFGQRKKLKGKYISVSPNFYTRRISKTGNSLKKI